MSDVYWVYKIIGDRGKNKVGGVAQFTLVGSAINERKRKRNSN